MNMVILFLMPLVAVAAIMLPLFISLKRMHDKKPVNRKRAVIANVASFFGVMLVMTMIPMTGAFAAAADAVSYTHLRAHETGT